MTEEEKMIEWIESARDLLERAKREIDKSILLVSNDKDKWDSAYDLYYDINLFLKSVGRLNE